MVPLKKRKEDVSLSDRMSEENQRSFFATRGVMVPSKHQAAYSPFFSTNVGRLTCATKI